MKQDPLPATGAVTHAIRSAHVRQDVVVKAVQQRVHIQAARDGLEEEEQQYSAVVITHSRAPTAQLARAKHPVCASVCVCARAHHHHSSAAEHEDHPPHCSSIDHDVSTCRSPMPAHGPPTAPRAPTATPRSSSCDSATAERCFALRAIHFRSRASRNVAPPNGSGNNSISLSFSFYILFSFFLFLPFFLFSASFSHSICFSPFLFWLLFSLLFLCLSSLSPSVK